MLAPQIEKALFVPPGGYRSTLGTLKHIAGWSHVYRSYAFDRQPKHWAQIDWPRGLRETVELSQRYLDEVIAWAEAAHHDWLRCLDELSEDDALDELRPMHWGELRPLFDIVATIGRHHVYHAGEINQLLSIVRGEAWEEYEEVEENHISTIGHRVRPLWLFRTPIIVTLPTPDERVAGATLKERIVGRGWELIEPIEAAYERGEIDVAEWHRRIGAIIGPAYLAATNPRAQSGASATAVELERARRFILTAVNRDGTFLDVGCANGP